jgi:SagB-type dehydrogenase family enzyme
MDQQPDLGISNYFDRGLGSPSEAFHEHSKIRRTRDGNVFVTYDGRLSPAKLAHAMSRPYRSYRTQPQIALPSLPAPLAMPLGETLQRRESVRTFADRAIDIAQLSQLLGASYGVSREIPLPDGSAVQRLRPAPSAGALFPIEMYVLSLRVDGLGEGVYHYQPRGHLLECMHTGDLRATVQRAVLYPEIMANASVLVILAAIFQRTRFKYGERGYRFAHLDAGHIAQNLCLVSVALDLGAVPMGGFVDNELNRLVDMNGVDEAVLYSIVVGQPERQSQEVP